MEYILFNAHIYTHIHNIYFNKNMVILNLNAEDIMWNARLDDSQAGIKITVSNNLIYTDDTTLMTESENFSPY